MAILLPGNCNSRKPGMSTSISYSCYVSFRNSSFVLTTILARGNFLIRTAATICSEYGGFVARRFHHRMKEVERQLHRKHFSLTSNYQADRCVAAAEHCGCTQTLAIPTRLILPSRQCTGSNAQTCIWCVRH